MNGHGHNDGHHDEHKLLEAILAVLVEAERQNQKRHIALLTAIRGTDILGRLNSLDARLAKVAGAMAALDAQTQ